MQNIIQILYTIQVEVTRIMDDIIKPPINASSMLTFNVILFVATVFSFFFLILAINGFLTRVPKKEDTEGTSDIPTSKLPFITVQIPTYNEPVAIRCAEECLKFDYPKNKFEIIIGDDSNDNDISHMLNKFAEKHKNVKVVRRPTNKGFKAGNLNNMLKHSKGEVIVIFDSDFIPTVDFLKRIVKPMVNDKKVGAVQARWDFTNSSQSLVSRLASSILIVYHHLTLPLINKCGISFICGSAEAIRKDVLKKLGKWQNGSLTEDTEISLRLMEEGYKTVYLPDLVSRGEVPFTFKGFRRQQKRWAYGTIRAFIDHRKNIFGNKHFSVKQKLMLSFVLFGYIISPILALLFVTGMISFMSNPTGPIDLIEFSMSVGRNVFLTSGFIVASLVALWKNKQIKMFPMLLISSFTVGIFVSFSVTIAILKSIGGRPMEWYMVQKNGNKMYDIPKGSILHHTPKTYV